MNTIEGNKLIAEFMGIPKCDRHTDGECGHYKFGSGIYLWPQEMQYHTSWDWIMPVVEKIEGMDYCITIEKGGGQTQYCKIIQSKRLFADAFSHNAKIEAVYSAVLQFIQWYTTHSPLNPQI